MKFTAILAEDEPILRAQLKARLGRLWPELQVLAEVGDGEAALEAIEEHRPLLAFLDIQMPELTGIEVARRLAELPAPRCHVVFVTAFDQYAVAAFEADAIDYVLKPYTEERLGATIERVRSRLQQSPAPTQDLAGLLARLSQQIDKPREPLRWIKASVGQTLRLIPIDEVLFFQSDEKYTLVATAELDALIRTPIKDILEGVDPEQFWQIHRSTLVNARAIESVSRDFRGQASVRVRGRKENLVVSRPFSHLFKQM